MIEVYALMFFTAFLRQSTTSPPQSINEWIFLIFMFVLIQGGGLSVIWLIVKTRNEVWQKQQEAAVTDQTSKSKEDSDQAAALLEMAKTSGQLAPLIASAIENGKQQAEILDALSARMAAQHVEASTERQKIMSGIAVDVMNTKADIDAHREESKDWVNHIREDIAGLRKDFKEQMDKALEALAKAPSSKAHEEATAQILKAIASLDAKIDAKIQEVETKMDTLPLAPPPPEVKPPVVDGPAEPPVIAPTVESKPQ